MPSLCELYRPDPHSTVSSLRSRHNDRSPMLKTTMQPPLIIVGMHRSGTTLVTELLSRLGLFVGLGRDRHGEASFFRRRNEWLLWRAGGSWDWPDPLATLIRDPALRARTVELLSADVRGVRFWGFTGGWPQLRPHRSPRVRSPWGWKDPRTTLTAPLWREVFPGSRLLQVVRCGVDVAFSLRARERRDHPRSGVLARPWLVQRVARGLGGAGAIRPSARCCDLDAGFALWASYVAAGEAALAAHDGPVLTVRYEDLLADPQGRLREIAAFAGLSPTADELTAATASVRRDRAFACLRDPEGSAAYERLRERSTMRALGYTEFVELA